MDNIELELLNYYDIMESRINFFGRPIVSYMILPGIDISV